MPRLTEDQLFDLKDRIDNAKENVSQLTGQNQVMMKQLKDDWSCDTIEEAQEKRKQMAEELTKIDKQIDAATKELEKIIEVQGDI
jgi:hypothetical protein